MTKRWIIVAIAVIAFIAFLTWLFIASSKPPPGEKVVYSCDNSIDFSQIQTSGDKCRTHVSDSMKINYSTNPPTFGPHFSSWITKGFYETPRFDGNLVHSMEHGYIVIWYDCERKGIGSRVQGIVGNVYAQGTGMTAGSEGSPSASLESMPKAFSDGSCDGLKGELRYIYNNLGPHKLIIVPHVGMDHPVIATAWGRILKLNGAGGGPELERDKIKEFIGAFRDAGPENTNEP